jgi:hypothetical protein
VTFKPEILAATSQKITITLPAIAWKAVDKALRDSGARDEMWGDVAADEIKSALLDSEIADMEDAL